MVHELSSARILLYFILITPILQVASASQAIFVASEIIKVPVTLGVTSRDEDALYVQIVFDNVLKEVSDKVNMTFGYIKECVFLLYAVLSKTLREHPTQHLARWRAVRGAVFFRLARLRGGRTTVVCAQICFAATVVGLYHVSEPSGESGNWSSEDCPGVCHYGQGAVGDHQRLCRARRGRN